MSAKLHLYMNAFRQYSFSFALLFSMALLLQTFPKSLLILDYYVNMDDYISLCVNKGNPDMHCDGSCLLDKKLHEMDHHEHENPLLPRNVISAPVYLAVQSFELHLKRPIVTAETQQFFYKDFLHPLKAVNTLLRPPQLFS